MTIPYIARLRGNFLQILIPMRFVWLVLTIALFSTGCAGTPKYLRWYDGPPLESNKVAVVKIHQDPWHYSALVDVIDGAPIRKSKGLQFNNTETIELLPGKHQLEVAYIGTDGHSISPAIVDFTAKAGHVYELCAAPEKRTSEQGLGAIFFGARYHWTVWIIDSGTKEIVGGEKWEEPPSHFENAQSAKGGASNLRP